MTMPSASASKLRQRPRGESARGLGEAEIAERPLNSVDSAREDHVGAAGLEFQHGLVDGGKARGAGGIDGVVHAAEIEPVGGAACGDVEEDAGKAVFGPFGQAGGGVGVDLPEEAGHLGPDGILRAHVPCPARGAEDDGGAQARARGASGPS